MPIRGVTLVTLALFLGIAALILHSLAIASPRWKITKRDARPVMPPVSYGLWQRCEKVNITIMKQGVALGTRVNVQICRPNVYMRYSLDHFDACYSIRRNCPVIEPGQLPQGCYCRYLPSAKALQWLTILAVVFLVIGLLILYLKTIASPQNDSATLVLSFGPFICFLLTLLLMATTLIVLGAYLRRDTYEDYTFPLTTVSNDTINQHGFELFSLRNYAKHYGFSKERYAAAVAELIEDANGTYHTTIGWATGLEIIATALILVVTILTYFLGAALKSDNL
jgi:hypothetical protein